RQPLDDAMRFVQQGAVVPQPTEVGQGPQQAAPTVVTADRREGSLQGGPLSPEGLPAGAGEPAEALLPRDLGEIGEEDRHPRQTAIEIAAQGAQVPVAALERLQADPCGIL